MLLVSADGVCIVGLYVNVFYVVCFLVCWLGGCLVWLEEDKI